MINNESKMSRVYQKMEYMLHNPSLASVAYFGIRVVFRLATVILGLLPVLKRDRSELQRYNLEAIYPVLPEKEVQVVNQKSQCALSVIIPAYNAEETITSCLKSVLDQTTSFSYEVIVIDDGSRDSTPEILKALKDGYSNLDVILNSNGGASSARNEGLNTAVGSYVMFVDADDELQDGAIEVLMRKAVDEDADLVQGSWAYMGGSVQRYPDCQCSRIQLTELMGVPWGKVMKRSLFSHVRFPEAYTSFVDTNIKWLIYPQCDKAFLISDVVYSWRRNSTGITFCSKKNARAMQTYWLFEAMIDAYRQRSLPMGEPFDLLFMRQSSVTVRRVACFDKKIQRTIFEQIRQYLNLIGDEFLPFSHAMLRKAIRKADFRTYSFIGKYWDFLL